MITDCDMRTRRLIEKEARQTLRGTYGSVFELTLFKITHEKDRVIVQGELVAGAGQREIPFLIYVPRLDGPLDAFL